MVFLAISLGRVVVLSPKIVINLFRTVRSYPVKENHIGSAVSEIRRSCYFYIRIICFLKNNSKTKKMHITINIFTQLWEYKLGRHKICEAGHKKLSQKNNQTDIWKCRVALLVYSFEIFLSLNKHYQRRRGHWDVYYIGPQSFMITLSYSLAYEL